MIARLVLCLALAAASAAQGPESPLFPGATAEAAAPVSTEPVSISTASTPAGNEISEAGRDAAPSTLSEGAVPRAAKPVRRGVHLTGWTAGSPKDRRKFIENMKRAGLNTVVIALKEYDGRMFVRGVGLAHEIGAFVNAIPDLEACVRDFREAGIYTIGRIVLFKDDLLARKRPAYAVQRPDGSVWTNDNGVAWVDPYRREVWDYNLEIAAKAAVHFDEIQFDYIRFPSDGKISLCRYSRADHTPKSAAENLSRFLETARKRLEGETISVCLFGLTTTDQSGMGIGQHIKRFTELADFVSPMMYPSHYYKGEYGIPNPNREPYRTIHRGLAEAAKRLGSLDAVRPYFQDFSLGYRYGPKEVKAQILAAARVGVTSWILWNPQNRYTWSAIPSAEEVEATRRSYLETKKAHETN